MSLHIVRKQLLLTLQNTHNFERVLCQQCAVLSQGTGHPNSRANQWGKWERQRGRWRGYSSESYSGSGSTSWRNSALALTAGAVIGVTLYNERSTAQCARLKQIQDAPGTEITGARKRPDEVPTKPEPPLKYGGRIASLPTYRREEIAKHNSLDNRIWVTFKHGVYDVTDFLEGHPGGRKILLAAGKSLESFFNIYAVHKSEHVMEIMETLRIGNVHPDDMKEDSNVDANDPFSSDPVRSPVLNVNSMKPFNAEPPVELLIDNYFTPNNIFFVRNHLPVPKIDSSSFIVEIQGEGLKRSINLSVSELKKKFKVHTIAATVQCAGNRRTNMATVKAVRGLSWGSSAISTARWTGVKLADVLNAAGVKEEDVEHVHFQGGDKDVEGVAYEASIPAATAFDPRRDVLLAFEMNGEELPMDHGYPIRVVVPGVVGARNVKWLRKIVLSKKESDSHWQQNDYKTFNPSVDWGTLDYSKSVAIQEYPIQSAICEPIEGTKLDDTEEVTLKGYAWSGGGRGIIRVDVSIDGGKTWTCAELNQEKQPMHRQWAWTVWEATVPIPEDKRGKQIELVCKAVDTSHNAQPDSIEGIWNVRGLIHNAWHRVKVAVPQEDEE